MSDLTVKELKSLLRLRNLSLTGNKVELLNRLKQSGGGMDGKTLWDRYREPLKLKLKKDTSFKEKVDNLTSLPPAFKTTGKYKKYLEWMVKSYLNDGIARYEDIRSRAYPAFDDFILLANKKILTAAEKDINQYCGIRGCKKQQGLESLIDKYSVHLNQIKDSKESRIKVAPIYNGDTVSIYHPRTQEEAMHLGQGTKWCTAAKQDNMFDHYNSEGSIYVIIPKHPQYPGEKYQIHVDSEQYMNEKDEEVDIVALVKRFPIIKYTVSDAISTPKNNYWKLGNTIIDQNNNGYTYLVDTPLDFIASLKSPVNGILLELELDLEELILTIGIFYYNNYGMVVGVDSSYLSELSKDHYLTIIRKYPQLKYYSDEIKTDTSTYWRFGDFICDNKDNIYLKLNECPIDYLLATSNSYYTDDQVILSTYVTHRLNQHTLPYVKIDHLAYTIIYENVVYLVIPDDNDYKFYEGDTTVKDIKNLPSKLFNYLVKIAPNLKTRNMLVFNMCVYHVKMKHQKT